MTTPLPASARLAWWGTAWLRGNVVADLAVDAIIGDDATHRVVGLDGAAEPEGLATALGGLRAAGVDHLGLAWPAEGDPAGLGGPLELNAAALDAGEAVIAGPHGLVPVREGAVVFWHAYAARPRQLSDVGDADRGLRQAMLRTADALAALDVARWRPEVADELMNLRRADRLDAPPGTPAALRRARRPRPPGRRHRDLALDDDGGAVSLGEAERRGQALRGLATTARHALVAACSPEVWPPSRGGGRSRPKPAASAGFVTVASATSSTSECRRPDGQQVAAVVGEQEPPAARELVGTLGDRAAGRLDGGRAGLEVVGVEDHQRAARARWPTDAEAADLAVAGRGRGSRRTPARSR